MPPDEADNATDQRRLAELARAARSGDRAATAELLRALQDPIYRFALAQLADPDAAAEATQETGLRLLRAIGRFEGRSRVTTWALGVALNVCREQRRKRTTQSDPERIEATPDRAPSTEAVLGLGEDQQRLHDALDALAPRQREAITLRYLQQLSLAETAQAMGCSPGAVKATVWQALRRLRTTFSGEEIGS
ncbi:RNA polymerase sigma factor SigX [Planctomycetes bacterium MalM25]|nr:RNA polymerase sigma factor SigX [Planctomycetes bacterium MalM25]